MSVSDTYPCFFSRSFRLPLNKFSWFERRTLIGLFGEWRKSPLLPEICVRVIVELKESFSFFIRLKFTEGGCDDERKGKVVQ